MSITKATLRDDLAPPSLVAEALGMSVSALAQMRYRGGGPPYTRIGNRIRYRWSDVEKYLADNTVTPESA
jgi:hypothetical protein